MEFTWICACCGQIFHDLPMCWGVAAPDPWLQLPEAERERRAEISSDMCVIDDKEFYLLGCIDLPISGRDESFRWLAWVSLSQASFVRVGELWDQPRRSHERPLFGWLANRLPDYTSPQAIKCHVHLRDNFERPLIEFEPTDYPLAVEQREGITIERVQAIAARMSGH